MGLSSTQASVLDDLVASLPVDGTWCVFGSVDSVLRGLDEDPSDVDVLATAAGAERIRTAFSDAFVRTREVEAARIDEYRIHGEEVEVVYGAITDGRGESPVDLADVDLETADVDVDAGGDRAVPVLPLPELLQVYRSIDKDDTTAMLEDRLSGVSE